MAQHDFSAVTNQIVSKWDGETEEEHYIRLSAIKIAAFFECERNRCINCEKLNSNGVCSFYRMEISNEHKFTANDCDQYIPDIPF